MNIARQIFFLILLLLIVPGCDFVQNAFRYKDTTREFVTYLINEEYGKCEQLFALDHELFKDTDRDSLKASLIQFRELIVRNWGKDLEYTFIESGKKFSTIEKERIPPNTTRVLIEFSNKKELGVLQALYDDRSGKILEIHALDFKAPIPDMSFFWLFGLLALAVPLFNVYVILMLRKSSLDRKWRKYLAVILLNVPSITYAAVQGLSFNLLKFQFLLGFSFGYSGYLHSYWTVGIPLGGLYWFWKLRKRQPSMLDEEMLADTI